MKTKRQIKFRGKPAEPNLSGDDWVYGTYVYTDDNTNNPFRSGPPRERHQIAVYYSGDWNMGGWTFIDIQPETLGQYTGLKDKNGNEIYEGDILRLTIPDGSTREFVVEFGQTERTCKALPGFDDSNNWPIEINGWVFNWNDHKLIPSVIDDKPDYERMEIIGNIHDTKE